MNIFYFSKPRKKLFYFLMAVLFGLPLIASLEILIEKQLDTTSALYFICFMIVALTSSLPSMILGYWLHIPFFEGDIFAGPTNILGFILIILF